ncbi:MAG TPA: hypothetical protein VMF88_14400 [Bacteroidota bacterium]|nr:hypothetical protein [Bacteroidota bacterium]
MQTSGHLTEEEFALYVEAIFLDLVDMLEEPIRHHVMECSSCKRELMEIKDVLEGEKTVSDAKEHPFFARKTPTAAT